MKASEFDNRFDAGEDVTSLLDVASLRRDTQEGLPLTTAQQDELDRRLDDMGDDAVAGEPWDAVRARIERRLGRAGESCE